MLIHKLGQLRRTEKLFDRGHDRTNIDERLRCDNIVVLNRHALFDDTLHP